MPKIPMPERRQRLYFLMFSWIGSSSMEESTRGAGQSDGHSSNPSATMPRNPGWAKAMAWWGAKLVQASGAVISSHITGHNWLGVALKGCLVRWWHKEQERYWKAVKSWKSSRRWTIAVLTKLITTAWDMWQHCNKALHKSEVNQQDIVEADINQQIQQAYKEATLPLAAKPLMRCPHAHQLLQFPASYKVSGWQPWVPSIPESKI